MTTLRASEWTPTEEDTPFARVGGAEAVRALVEHFYDAMSAQEPQLAALHQLDADGRVSRTSRDRFALFLIGWLGGPQDYMAQHGHPRLRMRHARVPVDQVMIDAWLRCMARAMTTAGLEGPVRSYLDARFSEVAHFLQNQPQ